jgi:rubrerythrin
MSKRQNEYPTLEQLDRDGALRQAAASVDGQTRKAFLGKLGAIVGGGLVIGALPAGVASAASGGVSKGDVAILNYALTLEYLEAAFYKEAVSKGALNGETATFAKTVAQHEAAHVAALKKTLGSKAVKKPSFDFKGTTASQGTFQKTAMTLEDTGVKAYLGQAGNIKSSAVLKAAASILPVEARHAAWIAEIIGMGGNPSPAPDAFQPAASMSEVLTAVKGTGFLSTMSSADPSSATPGQPAMTG